MFVVSDVPFLLILLEFIDDDYYEFDEDLKEMIVYHEIHHAAQTSDEMSKRSDGGCGIYQNLGVGRMIMEAQTEWFAEEVYKTIHKTDFEEKVFCENIAQTVDICADFFL